MTDEDLPWLTVAAMGRELAPLRGRSLKNLALLVTGLGMDNASRNLRHYLAHKKVAGVLGIGLAGALSPELQIGDLVIGQILHGPEPWSPSPSILSVAREIQHPGTAIHFGAIVTVNEIVCTTQKKHTLADTLHGQQVGCVDMESGAVAQVCADEQIPYLIVRAISDRLDEDLPLDFNRYRKPDGDLDSLKIAGAALLRPRLIGRLWRLQSNSRLCAQQLALFVEEILTSLKAAVES